MKRRRFLGVLGFVLGVATATALVAAPARAPSPSSRPPHSATDGHFLVAEAELSGVFSYIVLDAETGEPLEGGDIDALLPPASVAKAPTALFALDKLGPDHRFETRLIAVGEMERGVLDGDLILQGGGDPETDSASLDLLAYRLSEAGLKKVTGKFLVDDRLLPHVERIDRSQSEMAAYNPSVGALNLNFNRVFVEWERKRGAPSIKVEARSDRLSPLTESVSVELAEADGAAVFDYVGVAKSGAETWRASSRALGRSGGRWLPVRRPGLYAGEVFRGLSLKAGMELPEPASGAGPLISEVVARVESRSLADILADMLRYSTNVTAEAVGMSAARVNGDAETLVASAQAMNRWAAEFAGLEPGDPGFRLMNFSGLSPDSRMSVRCIAQILLAADKRGFPALGGGRAASFRGLLPQRPYLDEGMIRPPVEASVRAKTGTLSFVSSLAGYIEPENGRRMVFAMIAADMDARAEVADLELEVPPGARAWAARARALQRALIRSWITRFAAR